MTPQLGPIVDSATVVFPGTATPPAELQTCNDVTGFLVEQNAPVFTVDRKQTWLVNVNESSQSKFFRIASHK